jgi:hypothetical protein
MNRQLERILIGVCAFGVGALVGFVIADLLTPDGEDTKDKGVEPETDRGQLNKAADSKTLKYESATATA